MKVSMEPVSEIVMVREGGPSTSFLAGKLVDGRPTPTMTREILRKLSAFNERVA
jgi:hypothetical protein